MSSEDPIESAFAGAVKGTIDWTFDAIKSFVIKLKDKKLAFIQDEETINLVKEQYHSGELSFYKEYVSDIEILFIVNMGLTLRKLHSKKDRRNNLRNKIFDKFEVNGVRIAQFVENGILNRYIGILIDNMSSIIDFKDKIIYVLKNINKHVLFVKKEDSERSVIQHVTSSVASNSPLIYIISGKSSAAEIVRKCEGRLVQLLPDYILEKISSNEMENLFFKRLIPKE